MSPKGPREGIFAAQFNGIEVGVAKEKDLFENWGEPVRTLDNDNEVTHIFRVPSFRQVDVTVASGKVKGILVHLLEPREADFVAKQLDIDQFKEVLIPDEYGEVLGQAYPERGLLFSYVEDADPDSLLVSAIMIEPISAEMFRLRAQYDFQHNYQQCLTDLEEAIRIDPMDADSYWLRAEYLDASGQTREALKSAQKAIRLKPANAVFRLTRGRLFAKTNRLKQGIDEVESVIEEIEMKDEIAGRAHNLLGDLLAIGPDADHQMALKHHLKAIDYSSNVVDDRRFAIRRLAKHTLVSAHMSVARDIAMGNFQRQQEVVPKWLLRATDLADEFIADDQGDELLQMEIFRDTLASYAELQQGHFEAAIATEEAVTTGRDMISRASDGLYKTQIERLLAETLLHAAKIHRTRGKHVSALQFATTALALLDNSKSDWEETSHDNYLEGQLQFVVGSIHAIKDVDHEEAIAWYKKARHLFVGSNFASPLYSDRNHGEMYVSMGLSFWEDNDRNKGIRLTQTGAELMKDAVESGSLQLRAMAVPYGNLATMHNRLGDTKKSDQYAKLVAKVEELTKKKR
jgi:tetratricopeptide (TPR) repeat protein